MNQRGFGIIELVVVMGLMAILATLAVPNMLRYYQTSSLNAGASEFASVLNRARQLAITTNTPVCVEVTGTNVQLRTVTCAGTVWAGAGTASTGVIRLSNGLQVASAANAIFTSLGGASTTATYTVTDPKSTKTRSVAVASTGRVVVQ